MRNKTKGSPSIQQFAVLIVGFLFIAGCSTRETPVQIEPSHPIIYVNGDVERRGQYFWTNGMTLQDAINAAGGYSQFVRIVHIEHSNHSKDQVKINTDRHLTQNPSLQPGDKIYCPDPFL